MYRNKNSQASRRHCYWDAYQISEQVNDFKPICRDFDFAITGSKTMKFIRVGYDWYDPTGLRYDNHVSWNLFLSEHLEHTVKCLRKIKIHDYTYGYDIHILTKFGTCFSAYFFMWYVYDVAIVFPVFYWFTFYPAYGSGK